MAIIRPPGPRGLPFIGSALAVRNDLLGFYNREVPKYPDAMSVKMGPYRGVALYHPDFAKHVLVDRIENYPKGISHDVFRLLIGDGLVSSDGELWRRQRKMIQPIFDRAPLKELYPLMLSSIDKVLTSWRHGSHVDMGQECARMTLGVIVNLLFGADIRQQEAARISRAADDVNLALIRRYYSPLPLPLVVSTPNNRLLRESRRVLRTTIESLIRRRRSEGVAHTDFLSLLLGAVDEEDGSSMSDRLLRDEAVTFLFAGYETTATALSWTFHLLARHPQVLRKVESEILDTVSGQMPTQAELKELTYTWAVLQESMRLYPPVWGVLRQVSETDEIGGRFRVDPGDLVAVGIYWLHRDKRFWQDPLEFRPTRFLEKNPCSHKYAYLPFITGPRYCIGRNLALLESLAVIAATIKRWRMERLSDADVPARAQITLKPTAPIPFRVSRRKS